MDKKLIEENKKEIGGVILSGQIIHGEVSEIADDYLIISPGRSTVGPSYKIYFKFICGWELIEEM